MSTPGRPENTAPRSAATTDAGSAAPTAARGTSVTTKAAGKASSTRPALTKDGVPLARVRRAPRPVPFLVVGAILGLVVAILIDVSGGEGGNYTGSSATGYLVLLCGMLGSLAGGVVFALIDRRS